MAVTRDQARRLLSDSEMTLFSESRNPALRALSARELTRRVERTRKLRDKSRDLLQRQRLSSRKRTGNKGGVSGQANERTARKGEVLDDMLQRFDSRLQEVQRDEADQPDAVATTGKAKKAQPSTRKAKGGKPDAAISPTKASKRAAEAGKSAPRATRAKKTAPRATGAKSTREAAAPAKSRAAAKKPSRKAAVTPGQALARTRELLDAKKQRDSEPRAYQMLDAHADHGQAEPGYQSGTAKAKALELHAGEIRLEPIHGSISTRDRQNQGKRDNR